MRRGALVCLLMVALLMFACTPDGAPALPAKDPVPPPEDDGSRPVVAPSAARSAMPGISPPTQVPSLTATAPPTFQPSVTAAPLGATPPPAREWSRWPVVPYVSTRAVEVYHTGLALGNRPDTFSVIGDCHSASDVFLGIYATDRYSLPPEYEHLQETIDAFAGSFTALRPAVRDGLGAAGVLSPLWADPQYCLEGETPLECDLRINRPAIVFVNLGTNLSPEELDGMYATRLRAVIETLLAHGSLPVLATKADNVEGDYRINALTTSLAEEYELPLWNFWLAVDNLPGHGLTEGGIYLTTAAWDVRNFSALLVLERIRQAVSQP